MSFTMLRNVGFIVSSNLTALRQQAWWIQRCVRSILRQTAGREEATDTHRVKSTECRSPGRGQYLLCT